MLQDGDDSAPCSVAGLDFFPRQAQAVTAPLGPVLVLAGPGSGKTRCLIGRIAHLIQVGADPSRICAITFTNKAAEEIASRLRRALGCAAEHLSLGTIHSLCLKILRPFAKQMGLPPGFGIADESHQRQILRRLKVNTKRNGQVLLRFGRHRLDGTALATSEATLFQQYQAQLRANRLIDYDDILACTRQLLENDAAVLSATQGRWDHVLVDEFQDLDLAQYAVIRHLAYQHQSIFGVGDNEQSIFSWRGADPRVIARFALDFGIRTPVYLNINCRSTKAIFETARRVLPAELNSRREITTQRESEFDVEAAGHTDESAEARWVVDHLKADAAKSGLPFGDYAVLYRKHETGELLEQALIAAKLPCRLGKGRALSDHPVIAQLLSSLRLILEPDSELELERLARLVLPEALVDELATQPGASLREKLRRRAMSKTGTDARSCWRLLFKVENLESLARAHSKMADLIDGILSHGTGAYASPLDEVADRLPDPVTSRAARNLAEQLLDAATNSRRVILTSAGGIEIAVRFMLRKVLPDLHVQYLSEAVCHTPDDLVLAFSTDTGQPPSVQTILLPAEGPSAVLEVFAALQILETRHFQKVFTEYVAFDTETTDKDTDACQVIELAAVRVRDGVIVDRFHTLVGCTRPIASVATSIHGYTDADLQGQPTLEDVWPAFRAFIGDAVLIAHYGHNFDVPVLKRLSAPWNGLAGVSFFDSLPLARLLFPTGGLRLADLAIRFGIDAGRSHHALDDTICLAGVFERLQEERLRRARVTSLANVLDALAVALAIEQRIPPDPAFDVVFRKGARRAFGRFSDVLERYQQESAEHQFVCPPVAELIDRLGGQELYDRCRKDYSPEDRYPETYERLRLSVGTSEGATLEDNIRCFLDRVALSRSDGACVDTDRVCLLTFHATKGLEFSRVYVVGVEDYQLPGYREITENLTQEIDEARRLLYVAMTRAKDRLCLTYCHARNGRPAGGTRFLSELGLVADVAEAETANDPRSGG